MYWKCPDCGNVLPESDWPYQQLARDGNPVCNVEGCDTDMTLIFDMEEKQDLEGTG